MYYPEIANRDWQQLGLAEAIEEFFPSGRDTFLTVACPGAGKTRFSIAAIKSAVEHDQIDLVVIVAPTETIRKQWSDTAKEFGVLLHHYSSRELADAVNDGVDEGAHGIVTTYAQMSRVDDVFEHFCASYRVLLVADEIHHCAEHLSWGDKLKIAFNGATKKLILSGTPFRSDEGMMPFIMHPTSSGTWEVMEPDARYPYWQACDEHVCRVVTFPRINAMIRFEDDGGTWEHRLDEEALETKFRNRMYRAALDPERSDFSRYLLDQAWAKLKALRETDQPDAAMLVVAKDNAHAEALKDTVHAMTGRKPVVVNSDRPNSSDKIARFRGSKQPIIIAVKMFSEGVDAPRIRVIAFLTQVKTEMWFRQIVGRCVRMQSDVEGDQPAFMYIPKIPAFEEMARSIEVELSYILEKRKEKENDLNPDPILDVVPPPPLHTIIVHGSSDEEVKGFIAMGLDIEQGVTDLTTELIDSDPLLKRFQPEYVALITKAMSVNPAWRQRFTGVLTSEEENEDDDDY